MMDDPDLGPLRGQPVRDATRAVAAAVVDDEDLERAPEAGEGLVDLPRRDARLGASLKAMTTTEIVSGPPAGPGPRGKRYPRERSGRAGTPATTV